VLTVFNALIRMYLGRYGDCVLLHAEAPASRTKTTSPLLTSQAISLYGVSSIVLFWANEWSEFTVLPSYQQQDFRPVPLRWVYARRAEFAGAGALAGDIAHADAGMHRQHLGDRNRATQLGRRKEEQQLTARVGVNSPRQQQRCRV
jgi:hypothetical protein